MSRSGLGGFNQSRQGVPNRSERSWFDHQLDVSYFEEGCGGTLGERARPWDEVDHARGDPEQAFQRRIHIWSGAMGGLERALLQQG